VEVDPDLRLIPAQHIRHDALHLVGQGPAVGVAEDQGLGTGLLGGTEDALGEVGIGLVPIEEMLGIEEDAEVVGPEELHRVGHHGHRLVERGAQGVDDVHLG
jgi:hypothetical protein